MCFLAKLKDIDVSVIEASVRKDLQRETSKMTETQWLLENKWLSQQEYTVQIRILGHLHDINAMLSNINIHLIVDCFYALLLQNNVSTVPSLPLPKRVYSLLITRLYEENITPEKQLSISRFVFDELVKYSMATPMLFDRGHYLIFFEKIQCQCLKLSSSYDIASFRSFMKGLAYYATILRQRLQGYKRKVCLKLYQALIVSLFKMTFTYEHYQALDCLYEIHPGVIRRNLQKLLLNTECDVLQQIWTSCPTIRKYCIDNILKWSSVSSESCLWALCKTHMDTTLVELRCVDDDGIVPK